MCVCVSVGGSEIQPAHILWAKCPHSQRCPKCMHFPHSYSGPVGWWPLRRCQPGVWQSDEHLEKTLSKVRSGTHEESLKRPVEEGLEQGPMVYARIRAVRSQ